MRLLVVSTHQCTIAAVVHALGIKLPNVHSDVSASSEPFDGALFSRFLQATSLLQEIYALRLKDKDNFAKIVEAERLFEYLDVSFSQNN